MRKIALIVLLGAGLGFFILVKLNGNDADKNADTVQTSAETDAKGSKFKKFSSREFLELFYRVAHPNTKTISEGLKITGDISADEHLKELAYARGYRIQRAPVSDVFVDVGTAMRLQPKAAADWEKLTARANSDEIELELLAAYRSEAEQRDLFLARLKAQNIEISKLAKGTYDSQIDDVLAMTALPGYSKHHNGYTVDIGCASDQFVTFENSVCFAWLSQNNYQNAKESGWIPSYPKGAKKQGPKPEAWEYVWVGREALLL